VEKFPRNVAKYVMVPGNARRRHPVIEERIRRVQEFAETFPYNRVEWGDRSLGIVTCGVAYQYAKEVFPEASILRLGMTYPLPEAGAGVRPRVQRLIVLEELDPFLEEEIRLLGIPVEGKSIFPLCGELDPRVVRESAIRAGLLPASALTPLPVLDKGDLPLPGRPPVLCPGCPHRGVFYVAGRFKLPIRGISAVTPSGSCRPSPPSTPAAAWAPASAWPTARTGWRPRAAHRHHRRFHLLPHGHAGPGQRGL
jgi:indolepyruvate ferredoxin oxidoreductase alpha subunit